MPKSAYLKEADDAFGRQLSTFKSAIGAQAATFGLAPGVIAGQAADADYFNYVLAVMDASRKGAQQWTNWKDIARRGGEPPATGIPAAPGLPPAVPAVEPGIEPRFRALVKQLKAHTAYNSAIGEALGIEGPEQTGPDMTAIQPEITATMRGTAILIGWGWGGQKSFLDLCEIEVDRGDGKGFLLLTYDSTPGYTDTEAFPAAPVKWTYRAIYRLGDHRVGQWSKPASVTVGA